MDKNFIFIAIAIVVVALVVFTAFNHEDNGVMNYQSPKSLVETNLD